MDREALEREIEERGSEESSVQDQPQCRICLDTGGDDMIAPCHCRGTQKYVHRSCLDHWRSTKEGFAFAHCTECRAVFVLRANVPPDRWWLRLKFQLLVVRDHTVIFFIVQLVVMMLAMLVYKFYGEELREMFEYEDHPYAFYAMSIMAVLLVGLLYGFFIAIICGQRIHERHYHVLAKQELTKEYIVEDREKSESIPELDSSHIMELRMLGLY
ncbi:RING/FYVE/PHD zinc finger superfamily protein [Rhynchospora pubera]|nr:RING/FYVE/PHD zinc finger superfamily protein [Rhynchospora pubera]